MGNNQEILFLIDEISKKEFPSFQKKRHLEQPRAE
jgi:hypothetical protein